MSDLGKQLDSIDFEQLALLGRSLIPGRAPGWTDHNVHDPGVMLIELAAWIADAQIYALARTRRDERRAYAKFLGVEPSGPIPARGVLWPSTDSALNRPWPMGTVIERNLVLTPEQPLAPPFRASERIQFTRARLTRLLGVAADGSEQDFSRSNAQSGATFLPFGADPVPGNRLVLGFESATASDGSTEPAFLEDSGADAPLVSLGVSVVLQALSNGAAEGEPLPAAGARLRVTIEDSDGSRTLPLVADSTHGLSQSGALLLSIPRGAAPRGKSFQLSIQSATGGFLRPPRLQHIAPNVLLMEQARAVTDEPNSFGTGLPDQEYLLAEAGLVDAARAPITVQVFIDGAWHAFHRVRDLGDAGPDDRAYLLDVETRTLRFGNGVNGALLPAGAALRVDYTVSAGTGGNLPAGSGFRVPGTSGLFGALEEASRGGIDAEDLTALRSKTRRRARDARPLVTSADLVSAALAFGDLGITRAREVPSSLHAGDLRGKRVLIVVGSGGSGAGGPWVPESKELVAEVRRRLAPVLPLGQSLEVRAPSYVDVRVQAKLVALPRFDPNAIRAAAEQMLAARLALVAAPGSSPWPFGRDIALLAVKGWLRGIPGVSRVGGVTLLASGTDAGSSIALGGTGLPLWTPEAGDVAVEAAAGGRR